MFFFSIFFLFTAGYCDTEEEACTACIDAQEHLCESLQANGCNATVTSNATRRVKDECDNGSAIVRQIVSECQLGDNLGCSGFSCN